MTDDSPGGGLQRCGHRYCGAKKSFSAFSEISCFRKVSEKETAREWGAQSPSSCQRTHFPILGKVWSPGESCASYPEFFGLRKRWSLLSIVKAGKARYIGISNCFAWQLAKANAIAEKEGFAKFVSVQGHYNLIFREEEREMVPYCQEENIALTPYSALASGRLSRKPGEGATKRAEEDSYAKFKYDATADQDNLIIGRVAELAEKHGVTMTEISLAWLLTKVTSPVVGATKFHHIEGAAKAVDLELTQEELTYLEELYVPHPLAGVMAQNKPANAKEKHVWSTGDQKITSASEK